MSDVVLLEIIKTVFWLLVFGATVFLFQSEVKQLIQSLSSFKVAGATFELKDKKETIRSYVLLAETLVDLLSRGDRMDELQKLLHPSQIEKLGTFALKYTKEVSEGDWSEELLKNIAYLLLRFGRYKHSVELYDALLSKRPDHVELLNLKALALMTSRLSKNVKAAEELLSNLVARYPEYVHIRFNLALALSLLERDDDAAQEMTKVIDYGYWKADRNFLADPLFHHVREHSPELLANLNNHLTAVMSRDGDAQPTGQPDAAR
ncbi:hypothetical protein GALL_336980 [mine drainage metagenome]|uniref:Uncharacterized protein n=1 Tax=mine drainage metagenome TaxID=410659 RepID=A0A1J5R423_9ZZZZ